MSSDDKTIYSLASAQGRAGVAVVRLSGTRCAMVLKTLTDKPLPQAHQARIRNLYGRKTSQNSDGVKIDKALVLWMPAPDSFTGEDVLELHIHGGTAVQAALFSALESMENIRQAEPGEFSRRAFEHAKLDLTAAEGLNDLVWAETEAQRVQALRQMDGDLGQLYESWRFRLLKSQALYEANIDFSDEDIPDSLENVARPEISAVFDEILSHLDDHKQGQQLRSGFQVVIVGAPNVGKSSLLNVLAKDDVAIVSHTAGTTRDTISVRMDLAGYPVTITDTAGIRESDDEIEQEGVRRALAKAQQADLKIMMFDATITKQTMSGFTDLNGSEFEGQSISVFNKCDLAKEQNRSNDFNPTTVHYSISVKNGDGIDILLQAIETLVVNSMSVGDTPNLTRARHRSSLEECSEGLQRFLDNTNSDPALLAEDIRMAIRSLGKITGQVDVEDMLDIIFGEFCIGK